MTWMDCWMCRVNSARSGRRVAGLEKAMGARSKQDQERRECTLLRLTPDCAERSKICACICVVGAVREGLSSQRRGQRRKQAERRRHSPRLASRTGPHSGARAGPVVVVSVVVGGRAGYRAERRWRGGVVGGVRGGRVVL